MLYALFLYMVDVCRGDGGGGGRDRGDDVCRGVGGGVDRGRDACRGGGGGECGGVGVGGGECGHDVCRGGGDCGGGECGAECGAGGECGRNGVDSYENWAWSILHGTKKIVNSSEILYPPNPQRWSSFKNSCRSRGRACGSPTSYWDSFILT